MSNIWNKSYKNDKFWIEEYGKKEWGLRCDYYNAIRDKQIELVDLMNKEENINNLKSQISTLLNIPEEELGLNISVTKEGKIKLTSNNLIDYIGIFKIALKKITLTEFSQDFWDDDEEDRDMYGRIPPKEFTSWDNRPEVHFSFGLHFAYEHTDGGTNGCNICSFTFSKDKGWEICK